MERQEILPDTEYAEQNTSATVLGESIEKASNDLTEAGYDVVNGMATIGAVVLVIAAISSLIRARNR